MGEYYYLYKNSTGTWAHARNPVFIAKHTYCRAVPIEEVEGVGFDFVADLVYELNYEEASYTDDLAKLIKDWDLI